MEHSFYYDLWLGKNLRFQKKSKCPSKDPGPKSAFLPNESTMETKFSFPFLRKIWSEETHFPQVMHVGPESLDIWGRKFFSLWNHFISIQGFLWSIVLTSTAKCQTPAKLLDLANNLGVPLLCDEEWTLN